VSHALADAYDLCVFDLDGVVYVGAEPVPGAVDAITRLHDKGTPVAYATNNASRRAREVSALLIGLGVAATANEVVTSAQATAGLLGDRLPRGSRVLVVGAEALAAELTAVGLTPVSGAAEHPVAVVQGYGPDVGWRLLAEGCVAVRGGALWVATNDDKTLPSPRGPLPGNGALVAVLATAVGREPDVVVGKPAPTLFAQAARRRGATRPLVIGDRLDTDIEGANRAGMDSLLVLTGVTRPVDVLAASKPRRPAFIAEDLSGLFAPAEEVAVGSGWAGWQAFPQNGELVLGGSGPVVAALRALCAAAWRTEQIGIRADGDAAAAALAELGLAGARASAGA
jgi:glycerol-1-phosphatase